MSSHFSSGKGGILKARGFIDGASRGNPGPSGYGVFLEIEGGPELHARGYLGKTTNNVAEYQGLLNALQLALEEGVTEVDIASDSQLLVQQMLGHYRVKHPNLKPLFEQARSLVSRFDRFAIRHVYRDENKIADGLANDAIDYGDRNHVDRR